MNKKVLLLGNGVAQAYYGMDNWNNFLDKIKKEGRYDLPSEQYQMPMILKAEMFAKNHLTKFLDSEKLTILPKKSNPKFLKKLLNLNFNDILSTNYTYEIEHALSNNPDGTNQITHYLSGKKYCRNIDFFNLKTPEEKLGGSDERIRNEINNLQKYEELITSYNDMGNNKKIWHIHGEASYPQSIVLGHKAYARVLYSYIERLENNNNSNQLEESWLDAFVNGDVYILGFGLDFAEIDLWWLLKYKKEYQPVGAKTIYFNPQPYNISPDKSCDEQYIHGTKRWAILETLKNYGVTIKPVRFNNLKNYKGFYENSFKQIKRQIEKDMNQN